MAVRYPRRKTGADIASRPSRFKSGSRAVNRAVAAIPIYCAEPLEGRVLLSVVAPGIPFWQSVGPAPIEGGGVSIADQLNAGSGSINAVATSPSGKSVH